MFRIRGNRVLLSGELDIAVASEVREAVRRAIAASTTLTLVVYVAAVTLSTPPASGR